MPVPGPINAVAVLLGVVLVAAVTAAIGSHGDPPGAPTVVAATAGPAQPASVFLPLPDAVAVDEASSLVTIAQPELPTGGTLVFVHGGGWVGGAATDVPPELALSAAADDGWSVLSLAYRLADPGTGVRAEDQVHDLATALRWVETSGPRHGLTGPVVVVGHSAGAHLASVVAARAPDLVDAVVGISGVYDTAGDVRETPMLATVLPVAIGCDGCGSVLPEPAPAVSADDPPVWIVHGVEDPIAPPAGAARYATALDEVGVDVTVSFVPGAGHDGEALGRAARAAVIAARSATA